MIVILGCGVVGVLVGNRLSDLGHQVIGVRRTPVVDAGNLFPVIAGDIADPVLYDRLDRPSAVLLAANPGLRRGRDNGLITATRFITARFADSRIVYTGSTAVYADRGGEGSREDSPVTENDPAVTGLLDIERAVLQHANALVLRITALVGPTRRHAQERLRRGETTVKGDSNRPFSYLHERDCAELCVRAVLGELGSGILNAAAPERLTVRDYYELLGRQIGLTVTITGDSSVVPSRWIDASRLQALVPDMVWRRPE